MWIGEGGTNYRDQAIRKGTQGPKLLYTFLSFSVVSSLADYNPFRRNPCHTTTESQSLQSNVKIFGQSAPAGGPENVLHRSPNPVSAAVRSLHNCSPSSRRAPVTDPSVLRAVSSTQWFLIHARISWKRTECFSLLNHFHRFALQK